MSRPLDRNANLPELGEVDEEGGEFWVSNPFQIAASGNNLSAYERNRVFMNVGGLSFLDEGLRVECLHLDARVSDVV